MKNFSLVLGGTVLGVSIVLACGEMTRHAVDAGADAKAQSDCTTCEKPLSGRFYRNYQSELEQADHPSIVSVVCGRNNAPGTVVGGGCEIFDPADPDGYTRGQRSLIASFPSNSPNLDGGLNNAQAWTCVYSADPDGQRKFTIRASVLCLDLAPPQ